jgi:TonB family protein
VNATVDRFSWFGTPLAITLLLHGLVIAALVVRWESPSTIEARIAKPVAIKATLVSAESVKPKPKPKPKSKPKPKPKPKPQPKPIDTTPAVTSTPVDPPAKEVPKQQTSGQREEDIAAQALKEIESALASEQTTQEGSVGSISDTVAAIIKQAVVGRWARPPSARNGMVAVLEIALVPTGDVVGVAVLRSSGDNAFDRSAINAVERAGRFPEVSQVERALFERDFRRFQLIFRPDDLRY